MSFPAPKLMLVASPAVRDQVADLLAGAGFPAGVSGDGDDATLAEFTRERPAVVVVCADLDAGDPRSLIHAMRDAGGDEVKIVLIGEERGLRRRKVLPVTCQKGLIGSIWMMQAGHDQVHQIIQRDEAALIFYRPQR